MMFLHVLLLLCSFPPSTAKGRLREFYLGQNKVSETHVTTKCQINYTDLVTVYDQEDNMELNTLLFNVTDSPNGWIGAHLGNRSKKWSNGDEVTYDKNITLDCGESCCATVTQDGNWAPLQCNDKKPFMCYEQDVGRASYNYILINENKTWFEAQLYCRKNHTDLASIRNEKENGQVKETVTQKLYMGNFWIGLLEDSVEWSDGGQSAYRNWKDGELQLQHPDVFVTYCNVSNSLTWTKTEGGKNRPLCYKSLIHISDDHMSWENALDYCNAQRNTSGLLHIESEDDQIETERELKRKKISEPVWIGLRQSRLFGFWMWTNGFSVGPWTNWKDGSAPEHQTSQHCGALEKVNGAFKWSDKDCKSSFRFLCERK